MMSLGNVYNNDNFVSNRQYCSQFTPPCFKYLRKKTRETREIQMQTRLDSQTNV